MLNEFREDLVSGEWVLFATGRAKRPHTVESKGKIEMPSGACPFDDLAASGNTVKAEYPAATVVENKYPVVKRGELAMTQSGPFQTAMPVGSHEVVVFKDHTKSIFEMSGEDLASIVDVYRQRYADLIKLPEVAFVLVFHNHGVLAGASIAHPHSQIIAMPLMPPDVHRSIRGSRDYFEKNQRKVYDVMLEWEMEKGERIISIDEHFVALCPFVSRGPYEIRIFPRRSSSRFETITPEEMMSLGKCLSQTLKSLNIVLGNPDFNFFIHTAPCKDGKVCEDFYTWHIEILPRVSTLGAFEFGSGIDINVVDPDEAAKALKEVLHE